MGGYLFLHIFHWRRRRRKFFDPIFSGQKMKWAKNAIKLPNSNGGVPDFGHFGAKMAILAGPIFFSRAGSLNIFRAH